MCIAYSTSDGSTMVSSRTDGVTMVSSRTDGGIIVSSHTDGAIIVSSRTDGGTMQVQVMQWNAVQELLEVCTVGMSE